MKTLLIIALLVVSGIARAQAPRLISYQGLLTDVSGTSSNNVWVAGYDPSNDDCVLLHFDGSTWKEDPFSSSGEMRQFGIGSVACFDSAGHSVTVITGTRVLRKTDDGPAYKEGR